MICKLANGKRRYRENILKQNWQVQRGSFRRGGGEVNVKCKICSFSKKVLVRGTRQNKINTRSLGIIICIYAIIIINIRKNTCLLSAFGKNSPSNWPRAPQGLGVPAREAPPCVEKGEFGICVTFRPVVYHHICSTCDFISNMKKRPHPSKGEVT